MITLQEVIEKMKQLDEDDFSDFRLHVSKSLLPVGTVLRHEKVEGQAIESYSVKKNDTGIGPSTSVYYITGSGSKIHISRENALWH